MKTLREFLEESALFVEIEEQIDELDGEDDEQLDLDDDEDLEEEIDLDDLDFEDEELDEEAPKGYGGRAVTGARARYWKSMRRGEKATEYEDNYRKQLATAKRKRAMANEEVEQIEEGHDIELKRASNGKHYTVHKIHPKSGIGSDQMKVGEKLNDSHVDDLHDMGYKVKIHK